MYRDTVRVFRSGELERLCKVLAGKMSGREIGHTLQQIKVTDTDPGATKWQRLFNALAEAQNIRGTGNRTLSFIAHGLEPSRFAGNQNTYRELLADINTVLAFHGLEYRDDGRYHRVRRASSLTEAEERASNLKSAVTSRRLHPDLLNYCRAELLEDNYFHAVLEATKGVADRIRTASGLTSDGARLVDEAFGGDSRVLAINAYLSPTDRSEQRGFANLLKGLFGTFRNPTAHAPRIAWPMSEEDALDLFALASYSFRRVHAATKRP